MDFDLLSHLSLFTHITYCLLLQVLEPNWHVMHNRLDTAKSIDEVWPSSALKFMF